MCVCVCECVFSPPLPNPVTSALLPTPIITSRSTLKPTSHQQPRLFPSHPSTCFLGGPSLQPRWPATKRAVGSPTQISGILNGWMMQKGSWGGIGELRFSVESWYHQITSYTQAHPLSLWLHSASDPTYTETGLPRGTKTAGPQWRPVLPSLCQGTRQRPCPDSWLTFCMSFPFYSFLNFFIYLTIPGLSCGMGNL